MSTDVKRFLLSANLTLSGEELNGLLTELNTSDNTFHGRAKERKAGEGTLCVLLEQSFGLDPVRDDDADRSLVREMLRLGEEEGLPAAFLHADVEAALADARSERVDRLDELEALNHFWDWVVGQGGIEVMVHAWAAYAQDRYEPVAELPQPAPRSVGAFSEVQGLWLVKRGNGADQGRTLYEVSIRSDRGLLRVMARFQSTFEGTQDSLDTLLRRALQITGFAVRLKPELDSGEDA